MDKEEFLEQVQALYELDKSDRAIIRSTLFQFVSEEHKDGKGELVTLAVFIRKYRKYVSWWKRKYLRKEKAGYGSAKNEKASIYTFVHERMWMVDYSFDKDSRDYYFFGNLSIEAMREQLKNWMEHIKRQKNGRASKE